jgi:hypothetical protein
MLKKLTIGLSTLALLSLGALAGCTADTSNVDEDTEAAEGELTAAGKALIGAYKDDSGLFRGLILSPNKANGQANEFIAEVNTGGGWCNQGPIEMPCPQTTRVEGTFTAGTKTITLKSSSAPAFVKHALGKYNYLVQGEKFSLSRQGFAQSLEKVTSYCSQSDDCYAQNLIHPMCMGGFSCTAEKTCKWSCGQWPPPPADACDGLTLDACTAKPECQPKFGPSACNPNGVCTADMAYKGCVKKPVETTCMSSSTCAAGQHCSVEDGVCNPTGMLAVCSGTCVN